MTFVSDILAEERRELPVKKPDRPPVTIRSTGEFWDEIKEIAKSREGASLPNSPMENVIFSSVFQQTEGKESPQGLVGSIITEPASAGGGVRGVSFASDPALYKDLTERFEAINKTNDELKALANNLTGQADVYAIYAPMEKAALYAISKNKIYRNLVAMCQKVYLPNRPSPLFGGRTPTLAVGWDKEIKRFKLFINKTFVLAFCIHYLFGSWNTSNYEKLIREMGEYDVLAKPLQFLIMHEMGHILFKHSAKKEDIFKEIPPKVLNIYGDALINIGLTGIMREKIQTRGGYQRNVDKIDITRAPLAGISNTINHNFITKGKNILDLYTKVKRIDTLTVLPSYGDLNLVEDALYAGAYEENPLGMVRAGLSTSVIIRFYRAMQAFFNTEPLKGRFKVGDRVRSRKTKGVGVVVKVNRDGTYTVEYPKGEK